jgi:hypothetical protein
MVRRVSWSAVVAGLLTLAAIAFAAWEESTLAIALGLSAITWAILSLKDRT